SKRNLCVSRLWVVNASPIISLAKIQKTYLLSRLCQKFIIPAGVAEEVCAGEAIDPARQWIDSEGYQFIYKALVIDPLIESWDLGRGESEVLSFAMHNPGYEAIIDDRLARTCANSFKISVRGTIGIILLGKKSGEIRSVREVLKELNESGLRLDDQLISKALELGGELE
ncbi:MAG: DUF3368 domain-containing protein, partial [Candidatus Omnitrophica bacterium]|nr:DUF3368 domain-containing protein [Candidatus Omnitrophota bacterium]